MLAILSDKKQHIVIVEDEVKIARLLRDYLSDAGYATSMVHDGAQAIEVINAAKPACVILDVMLPGKEGLAICRELRSLSDVPIVMITARVDEIDRLLGLELGADDYICKPFSPREVVVRIRNILRRVDLVNDRQVLQDNDRLEYGSLTLDAARLSCKIDEYAVTLTAVEFRVVFVMAQQPGRIFSRENIMSHAYLDQRVVSDRTIDTHIKNVRKKLLDASDQDLIHSVYGVGYKLE
ncbi:MAG: two-component system response regulator BaeR [Cryomorphaceae bacterium]